MAKKKNKTEETDASVEAFLDGVSPDQKRRDSVILNETMKRITGCEAKMWGPTMVGFGSYHYKYDSGREGDYFRTGFSPRKQNLAVYIMPGFDKFEPLLAKLGKYRTGKSCLYINKLDDVDFATLEELITNAFQLMARKYGP